MLITFSVSLIFWCLKCDIYSSTVYLNLCQTNENRNYSIIFKSITFDFVFLNLRRLQTNYKCFVFDWIKLEDFVKILIGIYLWHNFSKMMSRYNQNGCVIHITILAYNHSTLYLHTNTQLCAFKNDQFSTP
jgi:hypothetical protein